LIQLIIKILEYFLIPVCIFIRDFLTFNTSGTIGILLVAKQQGLIPAIKDILGDLIREGKHISSRLYQ
jgi:predicted nucleic acid-binding protein